MNSRAVAVLLCLLMLSWALNYCMWLTLNRVRASQAYRNAMEFAAKLDGQTFLTAECGETSAFVSSRDCSVISKGRPLFFHCDENRCSPTCGAAK